MKKKWQLEYLFKHIINSQNVPAKQIVYKPYNVNLLNLYSKHRCDHGPTRVARQELHRLVYPSSNNIDVWKVTSQSRDTSGIRGDLSQSHSTNIKGFPQGFHLIHGIPRSFTQGFDGCTMLSAVSIFFFKFVIFLFDRQ